MSTLPGADGKVDDLRDGDTGDEVRRRVVAEHHRHQHERPGREQTYIDKLSYWPSLFPIEIIKVLSDKSSNQPYGLVKY